MKELLTHIKEEVNGAKITAQVPKQAEYALMGIIKPKPGHIVWEFNLESGECFPAQYKKVNAMFSMLKSLYPIKELVQREGYIYIPALNIENAIKKYNKSKRQSDYYKKESPMSFTETHY